MWLFLEIDNKQITSGNSSREGQASQMISLSACPEKENAPWGLPGVVDGRPPGPSWGSAEGLGCEGGGREVETPC